MRKWYEVTGEWEPKGVTYPESGTSFRIEGDYDAVRAMLHHDPGQLLLLANESNGKPANPAVRMYLRRNDVWTFTVRWSDQPKDVEEHGTGTSRTNTEITHPAREDFVFDPLHYLALLEQKINALDQAAPLTGWELPEAFATLRRMVEARMGKQGKREFVQVLRLMEVFRVDDVAAGVRDAIDRGVIGFDAVKHLVLCRIERRPPRLDMSVYPYLPHASVALTSARTYMDLLSGVTS